VFIVFVWLWRGYGQRRLLRFRLSLLRHWLLPFISAAFHLNPRNLDFGLNRCNLPLRLHLLHFLAPRIPSTEVFLLRLFDSCALSALCVFLRYITSSSNGPFLLVFVLHNSSLNDYVGFFILQHYYYPPVGFPFMWNFWGGWVGVGNAMAGGKDVLGSTKFKNREILVQHLLVAEDQLQLLLDLQRRIMQGQALFFIFYFYF